jgi:hypothetical protein
MFNIERENYGRDENHWAKNFASLTGKDSAKKHSGYL